jgi:type 2 lantibiotic biosynthesis protein LanM
METLLSSTAAEMSPDGDARSLDSVLRTGLLPRWECRLDTRHTIDVSGLGFGESQSVPQRTWLDINTDEMRVGWSEQSTADARNLPTIGKTVQSAADYSADMTAGFEEMYRLLMREREELLGRRGPIAAISHQSVRFIFRPTFVYARIQEASLAPSQLANGADWSIGIERLAYGFLAASRKPKAWPILAVERRAVEQLDIPYLGMESGSTALTQGLGGRLEGYFQRSSYQECLDRIRGLDEADLAQQVEIIRGAAYCKVAGVHAGDDGADRPGRSRAVGSRRARDASSLVRAAGAIAEEIANRSIRSSSDAIDWLGMSYFPRVDRFEFGLLGDNLFDGRCGVTVFLAAYARVTADQTFGDLATETLDPLRRRLRTARARSAVGFGSDLPIGGGAGLGSIIYSLAKVHQFLGDPTLLCEAGDVAALCTPRRIAGDRDCDVMNGAAGTILCLLALHRMTGDPQLLTQARACGHHVLGSHAWLRDPKNGFAHGTAGMSYALIRLHAVTREAPFLRAAAEGLASERERLRRTATTWSRSGLMGSWCNGVPGITVARLSSLSMLATDEMQHEVEAGIEATRAWPLDGVDHLCCGNLGRADMLLAAATMLSRPRLRLAADKVTAWVVDRAQTAGAYRLYGGRVSAPLYKPSLFQGAAGIGYQLLRVAHPEALPSVLLWE